MNHVRVEFRGQVDDHHRIIWAQLCPNDARWAGELRDFDGLPFNNDAIHRAGFGPPLQILKGVAFRFATLWYNNSDSHGFPLSTLWSPCPKTEVPGK